MVVSPADCADMAAAANGSTEYLVEMTKPTTVPIPAYNNDGDCRLGKSPEERPHRRALLLRIAVAARESNLVGIENLDLPA